MDRKTATLDVDGKRYRTFPIEHLTDIDKLPYSIRILLENTIRNLDGEKILEAHIDALAGWPKGVGEREIPFMPARVVLQDFTGVPAIVDLTAMRSALERGGKDPGELNPKIPVDLVVDHSVQVDYFGTPAAFDRNVEMEYRRNAERYAILKWAQEHFDRFRVVPPGTGIVHQVNLEYLSQVVVSRNDGDGLVACPDTLLGTDSHTTMINGISVLGWGVGGIEAEAVMLGQPYFMVLPDVVGFRLSGALPEGATATDLVLTVTQILRQHGVVGKFVEFTGPGLSSLSLPDRATIANMSPEYGATMGFFPVDDETLDYLRRTGREGLVPLVEAYTKNQRLFCTDESPQPHYPDSIELDLGDVVPSMAGPRRPQDRVPLDEMPASFRGELPGLMKGGSRGDPATGESKVDIEIDGRETSIGHGSVVIAAITSCTNTSNPSVLIGAGLLARNAVERGLEVKPYVKTSLAPGSRVVTSYLEESGLLPALEALRFHIVGYGCTTCIGNSGPLPEPVSEAVDRHDLVVAAVLSGNRNFEARVHSQVRANYLASPMLVVAYALAGRIDIDFRNDPIGKGHDGKPLYLGDIWPSLKDIREVMTEAVSADQFRERYAEVFEGDENWRSLDIPAGDVYRWNPESTYLQEPPFFIDLEPEPPTLRDITGARVMALLGDTVTTDHISPAGAIAPDSPAGKYLRSRGVSQRDFNTYGSRRGNHEVMMRGTFANVRLRNYMLDGVEGGYTLHVPSGDRMTIFDAAMRYRDEGTPLVVLAGTQYGTGSSRDWAAKGTYLLGVKAVISESYERIHRSNLIGMGVLPLQFMDGSGWKSLGLTGRETISITGLSGDPVPRMTLEVMAVGDERREKSFPVLVRLDSPFEIDVYRHGGILLKVMRELA